MKKYAFVQIAICEDDESIIDIIQTTLEKFFFDTIYEVKVSRFTSGEALLHADPLFDLVLMDIELPGINGLEASRNLRNNGWRGNIIILTGHKKYALQAFDVEPVGYVMKKDISTVTGIIVDILEKRKGRPFQSIPQIRIKNDPISPTDIRYVSSSGHKLIYYFRYQKEVITHIESLDAIEKLLSKYDFFRIHQSYLVNMNCVKSILNYKVTLDNDETLPIPRYNYQKVRQEFLAFAGGFYD